MMMLDHAVVPTVVLVVEDEMLLRMRAVDMVEDAGFTPVEAVDADEAVAILESRSDIALLFTDIQMPGSMDGLKLAHAVRERWPPIKIILVSGQLKGESLDIPANSRFFGKPPQAEISARSLLAQAGIDAKEREAADKLQKLILEELHHRIKNTLATVSAIASQSLRSVPGAEHAQHAIEGRLLALGRAHDLLLQARWTSADLEKIVRGATEAFDFPTRPGSPLPDLTSG